MPAARRRYFAQARLITAGQSRTAVRNSSEASNNPLTHRVRLLRFLPGLTGQERGPSANDADYHSSSLFFD